jgi:hypothetical protein
VAALISVAQVEARLRRTLAGDFRTQAEAFCQDASALARQIADGALDDADHTSVPAAVTPVLYQMVRRAIENPHSLSEEGTDSVYRWKVPSGGEHLYATDEEAEIIRDAVGTAGIGGIDMEGYLPPRLHVDDTFFINSL